MPVNILAYFTPDIFPCVWEHVYTHTHRVTSTHPHSFFQLEPWSMGGLIAAAVKIYKCDVQKA